MREEQQDEHVSTLCLAARQRGWEKAVVERYGNLDQVPWVADLSRADPLLFTRIHRGSTVLDVGCRYGVLSFALAPLCRSIISLDPDEKYAEFVKIRSQQDKIDNVISLCGAFNQIPFQERSFDLIIINRQVISHTVKEHLDEILETAYALLKPKGQIFVGVDRSSCRSPEYFFPYKIIRERLCSIGFQIDKVIIPLKRYQSFKFLINYNNWSHLKYMVNLIINDYAAKNYRRQFYQRLAMIFRYATISSLLFRGFLLRSYLILASKN